MDDGIRQHAAQARRFKLTIVPREPNQPAVADYYPDYKKWSDAVEHACVCFGDPIYYDSDELNKMEKFGFRDDRSYLWLFEYNESAWKE